MKPWQQTVDESDAMEREFPIDSVVIHSRTGNRWKVVGHTMSSLKVTPLWPSGSQGVAYLSAAECKRE